MMLATQITSCRARHRSCSFAADMNTEYIDWEQAALERLEKIPRFVRAMAKSKIEQAARAAGEATVTVAFMDANKAKLMG
jgi:hypothetical protein